MKIENAIYDFKRSLKEKEIKEITITRYMNVINNYIEFSKITDTKQINKESLIQYKQHIETFKKPNTVNNEIVILNSFLAYFEFNDLKLKRLKQQFKITLDNILTVSDYHRLLRWSEKLNKMKMYYLMETLKETGIRVSEIKFVTVEAVKEGLAKNCNSKGTADRIIFFNSFIKKELLKYCKENDITSGQIFVSRNGTVLTNDYIYRELQRIAGKSKVAKSKCHAHSFRHLFAVEYLKNPAHNIVDLKNILGHKDISTTQIYLAKNQKELQKTLED